MNDHPRSPQHLVDDAMRALCWGPSTDHDAGLIAHAVAAELGAMLESTVLSKTLCLLAAHLDHTPVTGLPRPAARFFASALRANRHKTTLYRSEAITITTALHTAGITAAVLGGLSVAHTLYGGTGARHLSDIDLLITARQATRASTILHSLNYQPTTPHGPLIRTINDPLVPQCIIDLTTTLPHIHTANAIDILLSRRVELRLPGHSEPLPVLAPTDTLEYGLARLGQTTHNDTTPGTNRPRWHLTADALRLSRATPLQRSEYAPLAMHGWTTLRGIWPQLPAHPANTRPAILDIR